MRVEFRDTSPEPIRHLAVYGVRAFFLRYDVFLLSASFWLSYFPVCSEGAGARGARWSKRFSVVGMVGHESGKDVAILYGMAD